MPIQGLVVAKYMLHENGVKVVGRERYSQQCVTCSNESKEIMKIKNENKNFPIQTNK